MSENSTALLERFRRGYGKDIDLTLRPAYLDLLKKLGSPQDHLPPVFHVAGTNGKGSTCAFLRSILEAAGFRVHVYTSPHLVSFYERIRIAGELISEHTLVQLLQECERFSAPGEVTYFEVITAVALAAFARHAADYTILEVGFGGRLDATNVVEKPLATLITRLSYDHREFLGATIDKIASEKAGIMRKDVPCFTIDQPEELARETLRAVARQRRTPLKVADQDWHVEITEEGFRFKSETADLSLPPPGLLGWHQYQNAGLAIAALSTLPISLNEKTISEGLRKVAWPARLQQLNIHDFKGLEHSDAELWLDGGHNDSAGEVLAIQAEAWQRKDGATPKPLIVIMAMLTTKNPQEFLAPLLPFVSRVIALAVPDEPTGFSAHTLASLLREFAPDTVAEAGNFHEALKIASVYRPPQRSPRILVCGSLYLAGSVLTFLQN